MTSSTKLDPSPCLNQILECNGVSFENIELAEAVVHLKSGKELDLLILKGSQVRIPQGALKSLVCEFKDIHLSVKL